MLLGSTSSPEVEEEQQDRCSARYLEKPPVSDAIGESCQHHLPHGEGALGQDHGLRPPRGPHPLCNCANREVEGRPAPGTVPPWCSPDAAPSTWTSDPFACGHLWPGLPTRLPQAVCAHGLLRPQDLTSRLRASGPIHSRRDTLLKVYPATAVATAKRRTI